VSAFTEQYGPWALVTGAASGIGAAFAEQLASRGLKLVVVDKQGERLKQRAGEWAGRHGVEVRPVPVDLRGDRFLGALEPAVRGLEIGLLVSNAAAAFTGPLLEHDPDEEVGLVHLNCRAPLRLIQRFAPPMVERGRGGVLIVASTVAFNGGPWIANYAATKAYNLALGDALAVELAHTGVDVTVLAPGMTDTEGLRGSMDVERATFPPMDPRVVARAGLDGLGHTPLVVPGGVNKLATSVSKLLPRRVRHRIMTSKRIRPFKG
jgi:short-subunit dehydrogenase